MLEPVRALRVVYVPEKPVLGCPWEGVVASLQAMALPCASKTSEDAEEHRVLLRMAYGQRFLYFLFDVSTEHYVSRDRSYQFGDGCIITLVRASADHSPASEYYEFGFCVQDRPDRRWAERVLLERDQRTLFERLPDSFEVAATVHDGRLWFEVCFPWRDVPPYHPWLDASIGLNVVFAKAVGEKDTVDYAYFLEGPSSEEQPRSYLAVSFEEPETLSGHAIAAMTDGHILSGRSLPTRLRVRAAREISDRVTLRAYTAEGEAVGIWSRQVSCSPGITTIDWDVPTEDLRPGGYVVRMWSTHDAVAMERGITVLPPHEQAEAHKRIEALKDRTTPGVLATLRFQAEEAFASVAKLSPRQSAGRERVALEALEASLRAAEGGRDPFGGMTGAVRRAYSSRLDQSLQPFTVLLPEAHLRKSLPLVVSLHGSGVDDYRYMLASRFLIPGGCFGLVPYGRGVSTWYVEREAQIDIQEAIASACAEYTIDRSRKLIVGFSMGAYGALRTLDENPKEYRGVAVFCVPPRFRKAPETQPDYTSASAVSGFAGKRVFVFHGRLDQSAPFDDAERMVHAMENAGASVTFVVEDHAGHGRPSDGSLKKYLEWARETLDLSAGDSV